MNQQKLALAVESAERVVTTEIIGHATCAVQVVEWMPDHTLHVRVDPTSQTPRQKEALNEHFAQNTPIRVMGYDTFQSMKLLFPTVILNVEHSNRGHIIGYQIKREVPYSLTKEVPKKVKAQGTKVQTMPPH